MAVVKTIKTVFQFRRGTTAEWELNKGITPAAGEPCFDLDLNTLRIGNGVDTYENLEPIGGVKVTIAADGKSIVLEDSVLKLAGFDDAEVGAQPVKNADGNIEWIIPSTEVIDDLKDAVAGLQTNVTNIHNTVTEIREIVMPSEEGEGTLLDRIEALEGKVGTEDVDARIDAKIEAFASALTPDDNKVNTLLELINYVESHGKETADMAADIVNLEKLVGEGSVDERIAAAVANKVTVEEGKSLIDNTLISKLEAIEEGAQANKIEEIYLGDELLDVVDKKVVIPVGAGLKTSDEIEVAEDGSLRIKSISFDKIAQSEEEFIVMDGGSAV